MLFNATNFITNLNLLFIVIAPHIGTILTPVEKTVLEIKRQPTCTLYLKYTMYLIILFKLSLIIFIIAN